MRDSIGYLDIYDSMNIRLGEVFGSDFEMTDYNGQITVIIPHTLKHNSIKFNQVMDMLSHKRTWYYRKPHAGETVFEDALENLDIPLEVKYRQWTIYIPKPPAEAPLEKFLATSGEDLQKAYELHRKLHRCYDTVDKSLRGRKALPYLRKEKTVHGQKNLPSFQKGQISLDDFFTQYEPKKKQRISDWRKIRFDMVFKIPELPIHAVAELKPFTSVANKEVERRYNQLMAYDIWLETQIGEEHLTPLLYVSPTIISHKEFDMVKSVRQNSGREVLPISVTTPFYLEQDLRARQRKAENVLNVSREYEMNPEVVASYSLEHKHVSNALTDLKDYLRL